MGWSIRQISEMTGITADTLRYYEKEGILSPRRLDNGYRIYSEEDLAMLKSFVVMKYARFTLREIKQIEELYDPDPSNECSEICKGILNAKILELNRTICNYRTIISLMEELLPMIDNFAAYQENEKKIDAFISKIFDDIQNGYL